MVQLDGFFGNESNLLKKMKRGTDRDGDGCGGKDLHVCEETEEVCLCSGC